MEIEFLRPGSRERPSKRNRARRPSKWKRDRRPSERKRAWPPRGGLLLE